MIQRRPMLFTMIEIERRFVATKSWWNVRGGRIPPHTFSPLFGDIENSNLAYALLSTLAVAWSQFTIS